jgi:hypothetical protein
MRHLQLHNHKYLWKLTYVKRVLTAVNWHVKKANEKFKILTAYSESRNEYSACLEFLQIFTDM